MSVRSNLETITPAKARKMLEKNIENRPFSENHALNLAQAIESGEWQVNGDAIRIDVNGNLKDGQHRLNAVIIANKPIQTLVVRNLPASCFDTIDRGKKRSMGDILARHGEGHYAALAGALTWLWRHENGQVTGTNGRRSRPRPPQAIDCLERNPKLRDSVVAGLPVSKIMSPSIAGMCHYLFSKQNADLAASFFDKLATGEGLRKTQAVYVLRERLIQNKGAKAKLRPVEIVALTFKAWKHAMNGDNVRHLSWRTGGERPEEFPSIEDAKPSKRAAKNGAA